MSEQQCHRVVAALSRQPWAITPDGLELVLGIAQRNISDKQAVLAVPAERREGGKVRKRDGVALISIMGPIIPHADGFSNISGATSIERLGLSFGEAVAASDVKAIVLHIDSPGGQVTGTHELAGQIFAARQVKPVTAYVSGVAGSAAYWLASAAAKIVADETAILGSIGIVSAWTDNKEARKTAGLTDYQVVSSQSPNKRLDPSSDAGRAALQRLLDETADIFIADVARNRGKRVATVIDQFGQGGVMLAAEAIKVGMADEIGSLEDVIAALSGAAPRTGRAGLDARTTKEIHMTKEELAAQHPDLLAQIQDEAKAEARDAAIVEIGERVAAHNDACLAMVKAVAGDAVTAQVKSLLDSGCTAAQIEALFQVTGYRPQGTGDNACNPSPDTRDLDSRAAILDGIKKATPAALATGKLPAPNNPIDAIVERIGAIATK